MSITIDQATDLVRQALLMALIVSSPMLVIGLVVGVAISMMQSVTQIQEATLSFIPKITAMVAAAVMLMPWIGHRLLEYTTMMLSWGRLP
jgi:flagellar biosynthetic protein FliQ